jgi:hypothetical protein
MSLLELILQQRLILASIGFAAALMAMALLLLIVIRMRKFAAKRAVQRQAIDVVTADEEVTSPAPMITTVSKAVVNLPSKPTPVIGAATTTSTQQEAEPDKAMQDLLNSVFVDEEALERYQVLLKGTSDIDIQDLATLSQNIVVRLRGEEVLTVQRVSGAVL